MSKKKGVTHVQESGSSSIESASGSAPEEVRASMLRVAHIICEHPLVRLAVRTGNSEQRRDVAVIENWIAQEESREEGKA